MAKDYGTGTVYLRGKTYWLQYYARGKVYRESAKSKKKMVAVELLKQRLGDISQGKMPGVHYEKVLYEDMEALLVTNYEHKGQNRPRINHLKDFFKGYRAVDIKSDLIEKFINTRQKAGASNGTINRELAALKRMFNLAIQSERLPSRPHISMLGEAPPRKGFFEHKDYLALLEKLPDYMRGIVTFAYRTGWRIDEIRNITWAMVDINERLIKIPGDMTKNKEPRTIYLDDALLKLMRHRALKRKGCKYVFHRDGEQVKDFRFTWNRACRDAGLGYGYKLKKKYVQKWESKLSSGPIMHDFRRTAVRNLSRSMISQAVAMKITGHKTTSVFRRYDIVSKDDLERAARQQEEYLNGKTITKTATN